MREAALFARLRPKLAAWGALSRVENSAESGTWDIHYTIDGVMGWVETKMTKAGEIYFERFQLPWARRHSKAGAKTLFVIVGDHVTGQMWIYDAPSVCSAPLTSKGKWTVVSQDDVEPLLVMDKPYDWLGLRQILTTGRVT